MIKIKSPYDENVELDLQWQYDYDAKGKHNGEHIPGKLIPNHNCVYISYGGKEIAKTHYQVLVDKSNLSNGGYEWKWSTGGNLPEGAIAGGSDKEETLYIAKSVISGEAVVGKFLPSHRCAYFPYGEREHKKIEVEILCCLTKKN